MQSTEPAVVVHSFNPSLGWEIETGDHLSLQVWDQNNAKYLEETCSKQ